MTRSLGRNLAIFLFVIAILLAASQSRGGDLFVSSVGTDSVLRYDGTTGAFVASPG